MLHVVTFISHFKIKFSTPYGVGEVKRDLNIARKCYRHTHTSSTIGVSKQKQIIVIEVEPFIEGATEPLAMLAKEMKDKELILGNIEKVVKIGTELDEPIRSSLIELLRTYADIFSWTASDMSGIDELVTVHRLSVDPDRKPVRQKRRIFASKRQKIIDEEIIKLLDTDIIFEINYPMWLANVLLASK